MGAVVRVDTREPIAALTFDDGPHPLYTGRLLRLLAEHRAKATFFVVGKAVRDHGDLLQRIAREGHAIGNHTWSHRSMPALGMRERWGELLRGGRAVAPFGCGLVRFPYGHETWLTRFEARLLGFRTVRWSALGFDWELNDADAIAERIEARLRPGSIILLHDALYTYRDRYLRTRQPVLDAVRMLLERTHLRFVTVPELLSRGRARYKHVHRVGDVDWLKVREVNRGGYEY